MLTMQQSKILTWIHQLFKVASQAAKT